MPKTTNNFLVLILLLFLILPTEQFGQKRNLVLTDAGIVVDIDSLEDVYDLTDLSKQLPSLLSCASTNNLPCPYNQNNGQRGIMFDITAITCVTIRCFESNFATGTTGVEIWYRPGTHVGFANSSAGWTLVGTAAGVAGAGSNLVTSIPIPVNVTINAGATGAFYITRNNATGPVIQYTNGTAVGTVFSSDANIQIKDGTGKDYSFGASFTPRRFNGTVFYDVGTTTVTVGPVSGNTPVCSGTIQTFSISPVAGATTYSWTVPAGSTITSGSGTNIITVSMGTTSGNVCVTPSVPCGIVTPSCFSVTVNTTGTVSPTATPTSVCSGSSSQLGVSSGTSYTWAPAGSLSCSNCANPIATPSANTVYSVTVNSSGCINSGTVAINVVTNPTVTANNTGPYCDGTTISLSSSGGTTYSWNGPSGFTSSSQNPSIGPATTTMSGTYTVIATIGSCTASATTSVTVNPLPLVSVSSATICSGNSTALNASGASTYSWSPGTGLSSTSGASVSANPGATSIYTVTGTSVAGCTATATATVTVNSLPIITVNTATICTGGTTVLTANGASTYTWSPATGLSSTNGSSVNANPASTSQYTIDGTDVNGCINSSTTTVTVVSNPTITVNSATICTGSSTTLSASGASSYSWSPATGLSSTNGTSVSANPTVTSIYTITGTAGTCSASTTCTVTVNPLPTITVNSSTICAGGSGTLNASGASTYSWSPGTGLSSTSGASVSANPGATSIYTVTGTSVAGCTATATSTVSVNPLPIITVNSATICTGGTTTLNANGASTYTWSPATGLSSTNGSSVNANPTNTTQYTITGTDINGCVNVGTGTVTVVSNPTITVNSATICTGSSTTLNASGASSYSWSPAAGLSSTNGSSVSANPTVTSIYTITGTAGTCSASTTCTVTVNPLPLVSAGSNAPICDSQNLNLTSSGGVSYTWNGPGAFSSSQQNPTIISVNSSNGGVYTVTVTDINSCMNTGTVNVVVNPLPVVVATGATVCVNQTINLSANNSGVVYLWSGPNSYSAVAQNPSIANASAGMAGAYSVTVTDVNGCTSSASASVVVNPLPIINATSNSPVCENGNLSLSAGSGVSWIWSGPNGFSSSSQNPIISGVQPQAGGNYSVAVTDNNGCTGTTNVVVIINPVPVFSIVPAVTSGCVPLCVNFTNTGAGTGTCNWNFGDGGTSAACVTNHCYVNSGSFTATLTVTDNNGCVASKTASVNVFPMPQADFYWLPVPATVLNSSVQFYDASSGSVISGWNWTANDANNTISSSQNPVFNFENAGSYPVTLVITSNNGCVDSITKTLVVDPDFTIYVPNAFSPNYDGLNDIFKAEGEGINEFKMVVFDRWGKQVFYSEDINKGWDGRVKQNSEEYAQQDVYVWKIELRTFKREAQLLQGTVSLIK